MTTINTHQYPVTFHANGSVITPLHELAIMIIIVYGSHVALITSTCTVQTTLPVLHYSVHARYMVISVL